MRERAAAVAGRQAELPKYEKRVVADTLVCVKTTRANMAQRKTELHAASSPLTDVFMLCMQQ